MDFDEYGAATGAVDGLLAGYCGTLATDCNLFPISFEKWSGPAGVPQKYKKYYFETILKDQVELNMAQSNESEASPNDIIGKLFGAEHSEIVRCLGMGVVPSNAFKNAKQRLSNLSIPSFDDGASSSANTYLHQKVSRLEYQLEGTLNALKTYMISKEGSIPDEFVGLFASQPQTSNVDAEVEVEATSTVDV